MMDLKPIIEQFKASNNTGKDLRLSLLPVLMTELIKNGLDSSHADAQFYQDLAVNVYPSNTREMQLDVVDALIVLGQMIPMPKKVEETVETPKVVVKETKKHKFIRTDHLIGNIPSEQEEGDPLYTAPEDIIDMKPSDFATMEYDEKFCASVGATKDRR